jgi:hypothetical protein
VATDVGVFSITIAEPSSMAMLMPALNNARLQPVAAATAA